MEPKPYLEYTIDKFSGINNVDNWENLDVGQMRSAYDIDITTNNKIQTRPARSLVKSGSYKDVRFFPKLDFSLAVKDSNDLVKLDKDFNETVLKRDVGGNHMSYAYHSFKVFYTNEVFLRYVDGSGDHALVTPTRSYRVNPKPGQLLEVHGFRLWIARGKFLEFTDVGKFHSLWVQRNLRQLPHWITMIRSVGSVLFISDTDSTYVMKGLNPYKATLSKVLPYPAIFDTGGVISGALIGKGINGRVAWWVSKEGICVGTENGEVFNLTESQYNFPTCINGASMYRYSDNISQFVATVVS